MSRKDLILLATLTLIWGVNWPIMKLGLRDYPPVTFRVLSMYGALLALALLMRATRTPFAVPRAAWRELLALSMTNMVGWYVFMAWGVKLLASGRAAILGFTMPIWASLIGLLAYRDRPSRRQAAGLLAAAAGVALLLSSEFGAMTGRPAGTIAMLLAAASWALGTQWMRRRRHPIEPLALTFWLMMIAAPVCTVVALLTERTMVTRWPAPVEWAAIAYNSAIVIAIAQVLWVRMASRLSPTASSLSVMLIPVIGLFSGMALLGERPHWQDYAALGCILVAIGAALRPARPGT